MWPFDNGCGEHHFGDGEIVDAVIHKSYDAGIVRKYQIKKKSLYVCQHEGCSETKTETETVDTKSVYSNSEAVFEEIDKIFDDL